MRYSPTTSHYLYYHTCQYVITWKELLCGCVFHVHVQHGHTYPHVAIYSMHKARILAVALVAWLFVLLNTWCGWHLVQRQELFNCITFNSQILEHCLWQARNTSVHIYFGSLTCLHSILTFDPYSLFWNCKFLKIILWWCAFINIYMHCIYINWKFKKDVGIVVNRNNVVAVVWSY